MKKKLKIFLLSIIFFFAILVILAISFLLFTHQGSDFVIKTAVKFIDLEGLSWESSEGSLVKGLIYKNIKINDLKWIYPPNSIKIDRISVNLENFLPAKINLRILNARLLMQNTNTIVLNGSLRNNLLNFNIFSNSITDTIIKNFHQVEIPQNIKFELADPDFVITGSLKEIQVNGTLKIVKAVKDNFIFENSETTIDLSIRNILNNPLVFGNVTLKEGKFQGDKTAVVRLDQGNIIFDGNPYNPGLNIEAHSKVENLEITIFLRGSVETPDLELSSDPTLDKPRILLALATNQTWRSTEEALKSKNFNSAVLQDFLTYFLQPGQGSLLNKMGIEFKTTDKTKEVTFSQDLSDRLNSIYEIKQKDISETERETSHRIGGEYKITDDLSIEAIKEIQRNQTGNKSLKPEKADDEIRFRFEKSF